MDSSSAAAEMVTLCCAAGAVLHLFTTGQGNIIGALPSNRSSSSRLNPLTVETMSEHIDVDLSGLLRFEYNLDGAADRGLEMMARTINGRLTSAEALRHDEFVITKLYRSA